MLAKELKIQNLKKQRVFIEEALKAAAAASNDGDVAFPYVGQVYPENQFYFEQEGFSVTRVASPELQAKTKGLPVYVFSVSDEVSLNEEELAAAEAFEFQVLHGDPNSAASGLLDFLASLGNHLMDDENEEEESYDEEADKESSDNSEELEEEPDLQE